MVAVAPHPVPDVVIARVGLSGQGGGIGDVVPGVLHSALRGGSRLHQRQGIAGVDQAAGRLWRGDIRHLRPENGGGDRGGVADGVVLRIFAGDLCVGSIQRDLLVRSHIGVLKAAPQRDGHGVALYQVAVLKRGGYDSVGAAVIGSRRRRHNGRNRPLLRIGPPDGGLVIVAGGAAGGGDGDGSNALDGQQPVGGDLRHGGVVNAPGHRPVAALRIQRDSVAVADLIPLAGDGQGRLARRGNGKYGGILPVGGVKGVVPAGFPRDGQGVCAHIHRRVNGAATGIRVGHRVLAAVNQQLPVVPDGHRGPLLLPAECGRIRRHLDGGLGYGVYDNGGRHRLGLAVFIVVIAQDLVPDGIRVLHLPPGGNGRGVFARLAQRVHHRPDGGAARLD